VNREQKQGLVSSLNTLIQDQTFVAVTHYKGLTVSQMEDLRGRAREAGAGFRVTKNRLTRLALAGTKFEGLIVLQRLRIRRTRSQLQKFARILLRTMRI
jgi:large subunit ribosomal protein L10